MEHLLKASAIVIIFYILYKLFLQKETFFQTNRWYLLLGLIVASLIPFIVIPNYIEYTATLKESYYLANKPLEVIQNPNIETLDYWEILFYIYITGVIFFLGKLFTEFASLAILLKKNTSYRIRSFKLIETNHDVQPFSFFNCIVYNPKKYSQEELNHILNHEKVHAKELHSLDVILSQIACIILWFNPFIWFYKKEIQQNLEFIADKKAQDFSECQKSYQLILLKSSISNNRLAITNHFYNSQIKKRIIMLHKSKSNKLNSWKYGLTLPVLALFLLSFNTKDIFIEIENPIMDSESLIQSQTSAQLHTFYESIEFDNDIKQQAANPKPSATSSKGSNKNITQVMQKKEDRNLKDEISITLITKNTSDSELNEIKNDLKKEGLNVKFKGVKRNNKGEITAIKIEAKSENSNTKYNINSDEAIEPIKIVFDEKNNSITIGNGHAKHGKNTYVYETHENGDHIIHRSGSGSNVFVISDEEHEHDEDYEHEHDTKLIIRSNGKKGKVKTIKKSKNVEVISDGDVYEVIVDDNGDDEEETIIINGKVGTTIDIDGGKDKIIVRGKGQNVWINDDEGGEDIEEDVIVVQNQNSKKNIFISTDSGKDPLYILDGKEVSKDKITNLDSDEIETMEVLKGDSAKKKYGDKGKDGVIVVTTKKKN